jgi:hypothetical protein
MSLSAAGQVVEQVMATVLQQLRVATVLCYWMTGAPGPPRHHCNLQGGRTDVSCQRCGRCRKVVHYGGSVAVAHVTSNP